MVNEIILEYLRKYHDKYEIEKLKEKIISSGYSKEEVEEAISVLGLEDKKESEEEIGEEVETPFTKISFKKEFEKTSTPYSTWLKVAGISGIVFLVVFILFVVVNLLTEVKFSSPFYHISFLLNSALFILFLFGFIVLGNKYNKKLIRVSSWLFIIFTALFIFFQILTIIFPEDTNLFISKILISDTNTGLDINAIYENLINTSVILLSALTSILLVFIILNVLFGLGLLKLKEQVEKAKTAGILHIVGVFLFFILPVAFIFEVILLFKESKKF